MNNYTLTDRLVELKEKQDEINQRRLLRFFDWLKERWLGLTVGGFIFSTMFISTSTLISVFLLGSSPFIIPAVILTIPVLTGLIATPFLVHQLKIKKNVENLILVLSVLKNLDLPNNLNHDDLIDFKLNINKDNPKDLISKILKNPKLNFLNKEKFINDINNSSFDKKEILLILNQVKDLKEEEKSNFFRYKIIVLKTTKINKFVKISDLEFLKNLIKNQENIKDLLVFNFLFHQKDLNSYFSEKGLKIINKKFKGVENLSLGAILELYYLSKDLKSFKNLLSQEGLNKIKTECGGRIKFNLSSKIILNAKEDKQLDDFLDFKKLNFKSLVNLLKNESNNFVQNNQISIENDPKIKEKNDKIKQIILEINELNKNKQKCNQKILDLFNFIANSKDKLTSALNKLQIPSLNVENLVEEALKKNSNINFLLNQYSEDQKKEIKKIIENNIISSKNLKNISDFNTFFNIASVCQTNKDELFTILDKYGSADLSEVLYAGKDGCQNNIKQKVQLFIFEKEILASWRDNCQWGLYFLGKIFINEAQNYINNGNNKDAIYTYSNIFDVRDWNNLKISSSALMSCFLDQATKEENGYTKNMLFRSISEVRIFIQKTPNWSAVNSQEDFKDYLDSYLGEDLLDTENYAKEEKNLILMALFETFPDLKTVFPEQYQASQKSVQDALKFIENKINLRQEIRFNLEQPKTSRQFLSENSEIRVDAIPKQPNFQNFSIEKPKNPNNNSISFLQKITKWVRDKPVSNIIFPK